MEMQRMEWFRFYDEVVDDPKVQRLPAPLFRDWVNILCLANRNDPRGAVPSIEDVAFGLRCSPGKARSIVKQLHEAGLLVTVDGVTSPNGWNKRQRVSDNVAERVKKSREKQASNVTGNVTSNTPETLPRVRATDTETETDTELTTANAVVEGDKSPAAPTADPAPQPSKPKRAAQIPADWQPGDDLRRWAINEGLTDQDIARETPQFVDHFRAKGEPRKDWDASFRKWMRNAKQWGHTFAQPAKSSDRITSIDELFATGATNGRHGNQEDPGDIATRVATERPGQAGSVGVDAGTGRDGLRALAGGRR